MNPSAIGRIQDHRASLNPSEARVAAIVLDGPQAVIHRSISDLADAADTSVSTVFRFCQRLGYSGFQDLKINLARDVEPPIEASGRPSADDPWSALEYGASLAAATIAQTSKTVDPLAFRDAVDTVARAGEVLIVGFGTSAAVALDISYRLGLLGIQSQYRADPHQAHVLGRSLTATDACLAVSHTGATRETMYVAEAAKESACPVIGLTSYNRSPLADIADLPLVTGVRGLQINLAMGDGQPELPTVSRLMHLILGDAIVAAVAARDEAASRAQYEVNHEAMARHLY